MTKPERAAEQLAAPADEADETCSECGNPDDDCVCCDVCGWSDCDTCGDCMEPECECTCDEDL